MPTSALARDELGAHVSAAAGISNAPARADALDAAVFQVFTCMPGRWAEPVLSDDEARAFRDAARRFHIRTAAAHDSYLINLASPDPVLHHRSLAAFRLELQRCRRLDIPFLVSHPGNATDGDFASAIHRNADALAAALDVSDSTVVLLETTAGSGRVLGASFDQLADLIRLVPDPLQHRVGVCLDTCHLWAAGYDLRNHYDDVITRLDDSLGLHRVRLFHLNDSVTPLASRRDRHTHIGLGTLGDEPFRRILQDPRFLDVPKLIETPGDDDPVAAARRNLHRLRTLRTGHA